MRRTWVYVVALGALGIWAAIALARSNGSPASRTGAPAVGTAPAEGLCTGCHSGNATNTNGSVTILGVPVLYQGGTTYHLTVHLASTQTSANSTRVWGFQLTAVDSTTGNGAGTFTITNATQTGLVSGTSSFSTRRYVNQISGGLQGGAVSPVEWHVDWTAPASGVTTVKFFAAGLACNGDGGTSGDWAYTGSASSTDVATPTIPASWGQIKSLYK